MEGSGLPEFQARRLSHVLCSRKLPLSLNTPEKLKKV